MKIKNVTGYLCPRCNAVWCSAKFAAECCGPEIKTAYAFQCQCTWLHKTHEDAERCTHGQGTTIRESVKCGEEV